MRHLNRRRQQGMALVISLVLLLVLTLLAVSHTQLILLHERMSAEVNTRYQVLQIAEAGLRDGERDIVENIQTDTLFDAECAEGLCQLAEQGEQAWQSDHVDWISGENTISYGQNTGATQLLDVSRQPRYIIERLSVVERGASLKRGLTSALDQGEWYRVTAAGYGPQGDVEAMVQSVYRK